ncbi:hypothetical protein NM688_g6353 [Phlebia brevispora]|uniref:Uncharacterized protein n=1 Tax=Phlebia brevispora TaxID=194682 RepID=A0ACC1SGV9_9APHY|nr:hypothetical protein NM688_g6353 [Phlebia brevispora]
MTVTFPRTQALRSKSFIPPIHLLEDPEANVVDLYEWNESHNADHPLFRFLDGQQIRTIPWREAVNAIRKSASYFTSLVDESTLSRSAPPVVAILATSDTITYFCTIVGLLWAGLTAFPISPRNGAQAVAELLSRTDASHLCISSEPRMSSLAEAACRILQSDGRKSQEVEVHKMPSFDDLFSAPTPSSTNLPLPPRKRDLDAPIIILHSSGSIAHPKPIAWSARRLKQWTLVPWYGDIDCTDMIMGCHAMPMFHGMGVLQISSAASSGMIVATFKPATPATFPTPVNVFAEAIATKSELICCVPSFVEEWITDDVKLAHMKTMKGMIFGGGPLSKETGNRLANEGIALYQQYGCTEVGVMNAYLPPNPGMDWEYLEMSKQFKSEFVSRGDGTCELVVIAEESWRPAVINTKIGDNDAYATSDLFIPHPSKSGLWKIHGRSDDQIMLSTGEKTNPGPLESILAQDPLIRSGVLFGRGRFHNGLIIDPVEEYAFDPLDADQLTQFRDKIWPTIQRMNDFAPQHSRIFKEMLMVSSPSKPFTYTAKGTTRRQAIISDYAEEIDALYTSAKEKASSDIPPPSSWDHDAVLIYLRQLVHSVLNRHIDDGGDMFHLQAAWIRNAILNSARTSGKHLDSLPPNFVFQGTSIEGITALVIHAAVSAPSADKSDNARVQELLSLVDRFTTNLCPRSDISQEAAPQHDVVLLTGSTGGFGCHILTELLVDSSIEKIYAFNRGIDTRQRQLENLKKQGLSEECVSSPKVVFLEGELSEPAFGLGVTRYNEVRSSVTHIIHNAWKVDFNQSAKSYEKQLSGLRNLVDMALSSPHLRSPRLLFTSSVGVFRNPEAAGYSGPVSEKPIHGPEVALGMGYAEAKWAAERILEEVRKTTGLSTVVVRIGQLCGAQNGYWNEREWFPTVVQSAQYLRCLPNVEGEGLISWVPSSMAAKAIVQMRYSDEPVLHLAHPQPVPWKTLLSPIAEALHVPLVPYDEWLTALEACLPNSVSPGTADLQQYPALRLLDFFRNVRNSPDREPLGMARLDTRKALFAAPSLLMEGQLTAAWAFKWLKAWRTAGLLSQGDDRI